jgi:hypothetical protein
MRKLLLAASTLAVMAGAALSPALAVDPNTNGAYNPNANGAYYKKVTPYCGPYDEWYHCFRSLSGQPAAQ